METGYNTIINMDTSVQRKPLSSIRSGHYYFADGDIYGINGDGYYWQAAATSGGDAIFQLFLSSYLYPSYSNRKGFGSSIRCLVR